jgi:hypothetical protein
MLFVAEGLDLDQGRVRLSGARRDLTARARRGDLD